MISVRDRIPRFVAVLTIGLVAATLVPTVTMAGPAFGPAAALNQNAASDSGTDVTPQVATDAAGTWLAVWASDDTLDDAIGADNDILVVRSVDAGLSWTAPVPLDPAAATDTAFDFTPHVATDGSGTWLAVWASTNDLDGSIGFDPDLLVTRSTDAGLTWSTPVALNTNAATDLGTTTIPPYRH